MTKSRQEPFRESSRTETPREMRYRLRNERKEVEIRKMKEATIEWRNDEVIEDEDDFKVYKIFPYMPFMTNMDINSHKIFQLARKFISPTMVFISDALEFYFVDFISCEKSYLN